ncbi:MAG TPA: acyl carrier protein [Thermomicrobiales bacterium]|nr:acyl carrier protein [Thermomicrobiales bacterium]
MSTDTRQHIHDAILASLRRIAPEVDPATIDPSIDLREQLDIDSIDFLNLLVGLHERLGIDIPESDYGRLTTLTGLTEYVTAAGPQRL